MVDFLEGITDHRFQKDVPITAPRQELSESLSCPYNSDEEEAVPELEKEEAELSMMMSQRWDTDIPEPMARYEILISYFRLCEQALIFSLIVTCISSEYCYMG